MTDARTPIVRDATDDDRAAVVAVFLACWRGPYAAVLPTPTLDRLDDAGADAMWRRAFARHGGGILVAELDGGVVGVARWRLEGTAVGRLESLYVHPDRHGAGIGGALLDVAEHRMRAAGARVASLSVFSANASSRAFYRIRGWRDAEGETTDPRFGEPQTRMTKDLERTDPA